NKGYHEGVVQTASSLVSLIYSYYKEVQVLGEVCSPRVGHHKRKWYSPTKLVENMVSHLLVTVGFNLGMDHFWVEEISVEVGVVVAADIWW
ncbi:hypothetical protein Golax_021409, partial [Gossypium laxum]|nr:hypothetical protein [Gossypium laxum]